MEEPDLGIEILELSPTLSEEQILYCMGVPAGQPIKKRLVRHISEAIPIVSQIARPRLAWVIGEASHIKQILGKSIRLARYLKSPEHAAIAIGTAGSEWEAFVASTEDPMKAFVYAAAATALARDTMVKARRELSQRYPQFKIGDTLSPGTNRLPLRLQTDFARLLPLKSLGVQFDPESLIMQPLATVTSVIGFGNAIEREEPIPQCGEAKPRCPQCPDRNCQLRTVPRETNKQLVRSGLASRSIAL